MWWSLTAHRKLFNGCPVSKRLTWVEQLSRTIKSWHFGCGLCFLQSHTEVLVFITNIFLSRSLLPVTFLLGHQEQQQQITPLFKLNELNLKTDASGNFRNTWRAFLEKKNGHSATLPGTQTHGTVTLWFCSIHFSSAERRGQCSRSIICNLKGPQVPGVVIQHDYWNYTATLIALIAQQLIKHTGFQTQKDKIGDLPPLSFWHLQAVYDGKCCYIWGECFPFFSCCGL